MHIKIFEVSGYAIYFSLASLDTFEPLLQRIQNKLLGWKDLVLSKAGRQVLVNPVLTSTLTYVMSSYQIEVGHNSQNKINFLWPYDLHETHKLHYFSWHLVTNPKLAGRLGFKDIQMPNYALLIKKHRSFSRKIL